MGELGALGGIIFIWACRMVKNSIFDGGDFFYSHLYRYGPLVFPRVYREFIHVHMQ